MSGLQLSLQETLKNKSVVRCTKGKNSGSQRTCRKQIYLRISDQIESIIDRRKKPQRLNLDFYEKKPSPMLDVKKATHHRDTGAGTNRIGWSEVCFWICIWWRTTKTGAVSGLPGDWRHRRVACRKDERWITGGGCCVCFLVVSRKRELDWVKELTNQNTCIGLIGCAVSTLTPRASPWQRVC